MDRRVKERLVGATILVVLIVLIVPELLSGPKRAVTAPAPSLPAAADPVRNVTVDLATSKATPAGDAPAAEAPAASAASSAATASDDPTSAGTQSDSTSGAVEPNPKVGPPTITTLQAQPPPPAALETDASSPKSTRMAPKAGGPRDNSVAQTHHNWALQLGTFASQSNAETLKRRLKAQSFPAYVSSSGSGKSLRYRVRVGPMSDRVGAEKMLAKLRKDGHTASVISP